MRDGDRTVVEYADLTSGERKKVRAKSVLLAQGSSARFERGTTLDYEKWQAGLITCYQYRVYLERPAIDETYATLEMHYYLTESGRNVIAWMFPKRDHLSIGLGVAGKCSGKELRAQLDAFLPSVAERLFPGVGYTIREEGNLLYGGAPRPHISDGDVMVAGTAAGPRRCDHGRRHSRGRDVRAARRGGRRRGQVRPHERARSAIRAGSQRQYSTVACATVIS